MSRSPALGRAIRTLGPWGGPAVVVLVLLTLPAAGAEPSGKAGEKLSFEGLLARHQNLTYEGLLAKLGPPRDYVRGLSFDPEQVKHFGRVRDKLSLTDAERAQYRTNGFVVIDQNHDQSFAAAYYQLYTQDLPVLVTCDSVLHALHRSYDQILTNLEMELFAGTLAEMLEECHTALARKAARNQRAELTACYCDVDLYLTVARNLLAGAGAPAKDTSLHPLAFREQDEWNGELRIHSQLGQDREVLDRLKDVQSLVLQLPPPRGQPTAIYGGARFVDYSQFRPRGHYLEQPPLRRYFRCLMWLGRADCGWNVLPVHPGDGVVTDSDRELRDAILLSDLFRETNNLPRLRAMDDALTFLVGKSDNLSVFGLLDLLKEQGLRTVDDVTDGRALAALKTAIEKSAAARQAIRSQVLVSDPDSLRKVPPPALFQLFGQRFALDSFVLSQVVFDAIIYNGRKQRRMMPQGLDVMAALGNDAAVALLKNDLERWNYSGNLQACRDLVGGYEPEFWKANLYNLWLDCLRSLDEPPPTGKHLPEAMRTYAWRLKQLQAQHASWAELRHDTILYAKQSFTAYPLCEYPAGYVEPYPQFYAGVAYFAMEAGRRLEGVAYTSKDPQRQQRLTALKQGHGRFFRGMADVMTQLETLARKELEAAPFTAAEHAFLKKVIDRRGGGSGPPQYDGWYCDLYYYRNQASEWKPTVVDVHTDPESETVLEAGVAGVDLCVVAVDSENDRAAYAGPVFSYYEFRQPAAQRLTDPEWQALIRGKHLPARPAWVETFHSPARRR
jgi:hypothetical protein